MSSEIFCVLRDGAEYSLPKLPRLGSNFGLFILLHNNNDDDDDDDNNNNNNNNAFIHQTQLGYLFVNQVIIYMFRPIVKPTSGRR